MFPNFNNFFMATGFGPVISDSPQDYNPGRYDHNLEKWIKNALDILNIRNKAGIQYLFICHNNDGDDPPHQVILIQQVRSTLSNIYYKIKYELRRLEFMKNTIQTFTELLNDNFHKFDMVNFFSIVDTETIEEFIKEFDSICDSTHSSLIALYKKYTAISSKIMQARKLVQPCEENIKEE